MDWCPPKVTGKLETQRSLDLLPIHFRPRPRSLQRRQRPIQIDLPDALPPYPSRRFRAHFLTSPTLPHNNPRENLPTRRLSNPTQHHQHCGFNCGLRCTDFLWPRVPSANVNFFPNFPPCTTLLSDFLPNPFLHRRHVFEDADCVRGHHRGHKCKSCIFRLHKLFQLPSSKSRNFEDKT